MLPLIRAPRGLLGSAMVLAGVAAPFDAGAAEGFVTRQGRKLMLNDREYRAIGVNVPHLSQAYQGTWHHWRQIYGTRKKMRQASVAAVLDAEKNHVAFIRFFASPGYPKGTAELYLKDKEAYWRLMDELFDLCRTHHVKLIPSLGVLFKWNLDVGELRTAVLHPGTKTYEATYGYVREFVTRYKDDPNILMWELQNEAFLTADVNMAGRKAPPRGVYPLNSTAYRPKYTAEDSFRFDDLVKFYREMTTYIKRLDPNHLVTSGDSGVREESMCRRLTFPHFKWRDDALQEHLSNLLASQPPPLDVISIHMYGNFTRRRKVEKLPDIEFLENRVEAIHRAGKPVFVGELGQVKPHFHDDSEAQWTRAAIDLLDREGVSLVAIWVWHFPWQAKDFDIPTGAAQPLLMRRIAKFNAGIFGLSD